MAVSPSSALGRMVPGMAAADCGFAAVAAVVVAAANVDVDDFLVLCCCTWVAPLPLAQTCNRRGGVV
eukprot:2956098-Pleurochrysis_carterae.AAC.1